MAGSADQVVEWAEILHEQTLSLYNRDGAFEPTDRKSVHPRPGTDSSLVAIPNPYRHDSRHRAEVIAASAESDRSLAPPGTGAAEPAEPDDWEYYVQRAADVVVSFLLAAQVWYEPGTEGDVIREQMIPAYTALSVQGAQSFRLTDRLARKRIEHEQRKLQTELETEIRLILKHGLPDQPGPPSLIEEYAVLHVSCAMAIADYFKPIGDLSA